MSHWIISLDPQNFYFDSLSMIKPDSISISFTCFREFIGTY